MLHDLASPDRPTQNLADLAAQLPHCMAADQRALRRRLRALERSSNPGRALDRLARDLRRSTAEAERRRRALPRPIYPEALPISARRAEIAETVGAHQVTIVCGETGSGKSTQLPKICLDIGRGATGMIGHTQPRRIAARSIAARVAAELGTPLGGAVGYKVRFTARTSADTYLKLMTDGILLAEMQGDRYLDAYDTLILDEAHERTLNIDFLLGYLKGLLPRRPDLKLIITSATIDPERFSRHFDDAPVIEVSGRSYPVAVRYRASAGSGEADTSTAVLAAVEEVFAETGEDQRGDVLVFLSGEREIRETAERLRKRRLPRTEIMALYARLSADHQDRVFSPHADRRIVLATNIAETSLTVPGIRYVIDSGLARISRYSVRTKVQRLPIEPISRASAEQRKGRAGRTAAGLCIRLYAEEDLEARPAYTEPEIRRTNLAAVILQMKALGLGDIETFPFVDRPENRYVADGYRLLRELGALTEAGKLTPAGRQLARLPVDPRIGRMILAGAKEGCLREVLIIASALGSPDPRERPVGDREAAREAHNAFRHTRSDFLGFVALWSWYREQASVASVSRLRRTCRAHFLSYPRMREWQEVHHQLHVLSRELGLRTNRDAPKEARIHRALLAGLLGHIGLRTDEREYTGTRNTRFVISPASALARSRPKWVVAGELVHTERAYAHSAARIRPEWAEQVAPSHLLKRSCFAADWDPRRGEVMAAETVSLYGLPIISRRRVRFGPIDPAAAREIFIRSALVEARYQSPGEFQSCNRRLLVDARRIEHRLRRSGVVMDDEALFHFYDARLPPDVNNARQFETWRKRVERDRSGLLHLSRETVLRDAVPETLDADFPDALHVAGLALPLEYRFEPGHEADGITVILPLAALGQVDPVRFQWLVPGLLGEKVAAMLRTLPKTLRRRLVPLSDVAAACTTALAAQAREPARSLQTALSAVLAARTGVEVPEAAWSQTSVPAHLQMNFSVVAPDGRRVASGKDLEALQTKLQPSATRTHHRAVPASLERTDITRWDVGALAGQVRWDDGGIAHVGYPALVDEGTSVSLRVMDTAEKAGHATRGGLRRLCMLGLPKDMRYLRRNLPHIQSLSLSYALVPAPDSAQDSPADARRASLQDDLVDAAVDAAFFADAPLPRTAAAFEARKQAGAARLMTIANELCDLLRQVLDTYAEVRGQCRSLDTPARAKSLADINSQMHHLIYRGFVRETPLPRLRELPRYVAAIGHRLQRLETDLDGDRRRMAEIAPLWQAWIALPATRKTTPAALEYRWLLEELRVSLFAQTLGTAERVSAKRLRRRLEEVLRIE